MERFETVFAGKGEQRGAQAPSTGGCGARADEPRDFPDANCYGAEDIDRVEPMMGRGLYRSSIEGDTPLGAGDGGGKGQAEGRGSS